MKQQILNYLRLGRAQTFPADWLLVLVPFLHGGASWWHVCIISVFMWFVHIASFGENSLLDFTQGYDKTDKAKAHHPLSMGTISVHDAMNFIHWGKNILMVIGCLFVFWWSPNPLWSMFGLFMWYSWGTAYNCGLSKESLFGFLSISICYLCMGVWAWLLSHKTLGGLGLLYLAYVFMTILFQISWEGHLKELGQRERSNILVKMGARLEEWADLSELLLAIVTDEPIVIEDLKTGKKQEWIKIDIKETEFYFVPGGARLYGCFVKGIGLILGGLIMIQNYNLVGLVMGVILTTIALLYLHKLTKPRVYDRNRELFNMSIEEVATIFIPVAVMLPPLTALILMVLGAGYFFLINKMLWKVPFPKV